MNNNEMLISINCNYSQSINYHDSIVLIQQESKGTLFFCILNFFN